MAYRRRRSYGRSRYTSRRRPIRRRSGRRSYGSRRRVTRRRTGGRRILIGHRM